MGRPAKEIKLTKTDKEDLKSYLSSGKKSVRAIKRGLILKLLDEGLSVDKVIKTVGTSKATVAKTKKRYWEGGLEQALCERPRPGQPRTIGSREEAYITSVACSVPPEGKQRWTLSMIRDEVIELGYVETISTESVRKVLKKANLNLG